MLVLKYMARVFVCVIVIGWVMLLFTSVLYRNPIARIINAVDIRAFSAEYTVGSEGERSLLFMRDICDGHIKHPEIPPESVDANWYYLRPRYEAAHWIPSIERLNPPPRQSWWSGYFISVPHWIVLVLAIGFERIVTIMTRRHQAIDVCRSCWILANRARRVRLMPGVWI